MSVCECVCVCGIGRCGMHHYYKKLSHKMLTLSSSLVKFYNARMCRKGQNYTHTHLIYVRYRQQRSFHRTVKCVECIGSDWPCMQIFHDCDGIKLSHLWSFLNSAVAVP